MQAGISSIIFELTSMCNVRCRYCYNIWKIPGSAVAAFNSYKHAKKTLKKLFKRADIRHITLTGGEPFLSERIYEIVLFCRMQGKTVTLITNGCGAQYDGYKQMADLGVGLFEIPFHSTDPDQHDYLTQVPGSWQKVNQSLDILQKLKATIVPVIVLTKANYTSLRPTIKHLADRGLKRIMLNRFNIGGEGISQKDNLQLPLKLLRESFSVANNCSQEHKVTISSNVCTPRCVLAPEAYPRIAFSYCNPDITRKPLTVDIYGNVRMCNHSPVYIGNVHKQSLEDIFATDYARSWESATPEYCADCSLYNTCFGGCRAASEQLGMGLSTVDPIVEA